MTVKFDADLLADAQQLGTATLHEAGGRTGDLPPAIRPVAPSMRLAAPACTVLCPPGDNLWIHRAIYAAKPGDVLVVATGDGSAAWGYWGEIMTVAAQEVGLNGLVLEGGSRDHDLLAELGFPVFSLGPCIRGTVKDKDLVHGALDVPIRIGHTVISPGDLIVADGDGVVAIARQSAAHTVAVGAQRVESEKRAMESLRHGASTLDLFNLR